MLKRFPLWSLFLVGLLSLGLVLGACGDPTSTPGPAATVSQGLSLTKASTQVTTGVKSALAQSFPQDTALYVSLNTATASDQAKAWQKLVAYLSNIPELKDAFAKLDLLNQAQLGTYDTAIKPWIGDELAVGVTDLKALSTLTSGKMPTGEIPALIAASVTDKTKLESFITDLLAKLKVTATTETYNGATLRNINLFVVNITIGYTDSKFYLGGGPNLVKAAIDRTSDKSLASNTAYTKVSGKLPAGYLGFVYTDVPSVMAGLSNLSTSATSTGTDPQKMLNGVNFSSLGLDYLGSMGVTMGTETDGFRVDAYQTYLADKESADVKARLSKAANPSSILNVLPESTFMFANAQDGKSAYAAFLKSVATLGDQGKQITDKISEFETKTGLSVQNDIAGLFPDEFAIFAQPVKGYTQGDKNTLPVGIGLLTKVSDKTAAQASLDKIATALEKADTQGRWKFQSKTVGGVTFKQATNPDGGNIAVSLGIAGDYAFVSSSDEQTQAILTAVKNPNGNGTFMQGAGAANFNSVKTRLTQDSRGYAYIDLQQAVSVGLVTLPADQQTKVKGYTDKLTEFKAAGFSSSENQNEAISTFYLYYPGIK